MSYQEFKQSINDMDTLKELRNKNIRDEGEIDNSEQRRKTRRKPKKIREFFSSIFGGEIKYDDVKFKYDQFVKYVKIVSNNEIELIHGGDNSELKKHLKMLWKTLAEEHENVVKEQKELEQMQMEQKVDSDGVEQAIAEK